MWITGIFLHLTDQAISMASLNTGMLKSCDETSIHDSTYSINGNTGSCLWL